MAGLSSRGQRSEFGVTLRNKPTGLHETTSMWCVTWHQSDQTEHRCRAGAVLWLVLHSFYSLLLHLPLSALISAAHLRVVLLLSHEISLENRKKKPNKHPHGSQALQSTAINQQVVTVDQKRPVHAARCVIDTLQGNCAVSARAQSSLCEIISAVLFCKTSHGNL